jgi:hypothetical protein
MFSPFTGLFILLMTLLVCGLMASTGVLASLRASTVRQASQTLSIGIMATAAVPFLGYLVLPGDWKDRALGTLIGMGVDNIMLAALLAIAALNVIVLLTAMARFKRQKLILD